MKARNAQTRSALLGAGLEGLGRAQQNQAGLITQAGLGQQAFTPGSGAGAAQPNTCLLYTSPSPRD